MVVDARDVIPEGKMNEPEPNVPPVTVDASCVPVWFARAR